MLRHSLGTIALKRCETFFHTSLQLIAIHIDILTEDATCEVVVFLPYSFLTYCDL